MATSSKAIKCICVHEFQDQNYGVGMRLHTKMKQNVSTDKSWKCTVCKTIHEAGVATSSSTVSNVKGKKK